MKVKLMENIKYFVELINEYSRGCEARLIKKNNTVVNAPLWFKDLL